jgi:hypothetical protein
MVEHGRPYGCGLEVGSKAELAMVMSVLADVPGANLICNGGRRAGSPPRGRAGVGGLDSTRAPQRVRGRRGRVLGRLPYATKVDLQSSTEKYNHHKNMLLAGPLQPRALTNRSD